MNGINRFSKITSGPTQTIQQDQGSSPKTAGYSAQYYADAEMGGTFREFVNFVDSKLSGFFRSNTDNVELAHQAIDKGDRAKDKMVKGSAELVTIAQREQADVDDLKALIAEKERQGGMAADADKLALAESLFAEAEVLKLGLPKEIAEAEKANRELNDDLKTSKVAEKEIDEESRGLSRAIGKKKAGDGKKEAAEAIRSLRSNATKLVRQELEDDGMRGTAELKLTTQDAQTKAEVEGAYGKTQGAAALQAYLAKRKGESDVP